MKILIVMDPGILIPVKGYGGHERLVEMFAKEYTRLGHEVDLLITNGSHVAHCVVYGLGKEGFPPPQKDRAKTAIKAWRFLWSHRNDYDLIHNFGRLLYLLPLLNNSVKKIMTYGRIVNGRNVKLINKLANKNLLFTAPSNWCVNTGNTAGKWFTVYNATDYSKYTLNKNVHPDAPLIFLSRIERLKGAHEAIKIAIATKNKLVIAGNISPLIEEQQYFKDEIAPFIDGEQIKYVGTLDDEGKNYYLGQAKAMLFPAKTEEAFGMVMAEAMACGTPVITYNHSAMPEVVKDNISGFVVNNFDEMISAVDKIETINRENVRIFAEELFDVKVIAKKYLELFQNKKIVIISTHQPAANPRAMKEFETLKEKGYDVKFLYAYNAKWSYLIDEEKFRTGILDKSDFIEVGGNAHTKPLKFFFSRLTFRIFKTLSLFKSFNKMSFDRVSFGLWLTSHQYSADLYIAHYLGALPAAIRAGKKRGVPVIFDAEDFHRGEKAYYGEQEQDVIALENELLPRVNAITTASPLINAEYKKYYPNQNIIAINNVFSTKYLQPLSKTSKDPLKLFWFSQHIGIGRGLEVFIEALNFLPESNISLTIMGNVRSEIYKQNLINASEYPEKIIFRDTAPPEELFSIASCYDIGLAGEISNFKNKELCLSNKIFTYLMAGNCVLASDMQGQKEFINQNPGIGFTYKSDDAKDLAAKIKLLHENRQLLKSCKTASNKLADEHLNWETESVHWVGLVEQLLERKSFLKYSYK